MLYSFACSLKEILKCTIRNIYTDDLYRKGGTTQRHTEPNNRDGRLISIETIGRTIRTYCVVAGYVKSTRTLRE